MKQASLDIDLIAGKTRKREFLGQMERVFPWARLVELIAPYYPEGKTGRPPFALETMLRVHFMQQWFSLSDLAMEEAFFDTPLYREFAQLDVHGRLPDESTILRFRHRLEKHKMADQVLVTINDLITEQGLLLKAGTEVDAPLIAAPSSTKNKDKARQGTQRCIRARKAPGEETDVFGDAGYQGIGKCPHAKKDVTWHVAIRPGKRKALDKDKRAGDAMVDLFEKAQAGIRAKVEHPFRVIKRQFGLVKVRYRGLKKNTLQLKTLFALSNLWMVRHKLMGAQA